MCIEWTICALMHCTQLTCEMVGYTKHNSCVRWAYKTAESNWFICVVVRFCIGIHWAQCFVASGECMQQKYILTEQVHIAQLAIFIYDRDAKDNATVCVVFPLKKIASIQYVHETQCFSLYWITIKNTFKCMHNFSKCHFYNLINRIKNHTQPIATTQTRNDFNLHLKINHEQWNDDAWTYAYGFDWWWDWVFFSRTN